MKLAKRLSALAGLAILASAAPGALAQASSNAVIGNVTYQLIDLDLNDGIDPWIAFSNQSEVFAGVAPVANGGFTSYHSDASSDALPAIAVANASRGAVTWAGIAGDRVSASGFSAAMPAAEGEYYSAAQQSRKFSLAPNTQLIVTAHASADVTGNEGASRQTSGSLSFQIIDSQNAHPFTQIAFFSKGAYSYNGLPTIVDEDFSLNFFNWNATTLNGTIDAYAGASSTVLAVPEPSTYGMLFAGLGLLGFVARRKRPQ